MKKKIIFISILLLASCGSNKQEYDSVYFAKGAYDAATEEYESIESENDLSGEAIPVVERKLIKTGDIAFETKDLKRTRNTIQEAISKNKGYVSSDNEYKGSARITNNLTIRVPSTNFDQLLNDISEDVEMFDSKNIQVSDVTEEFLDVQARLKTKKELEQRYLSLLNQAKTVAEILEIEREIGTLRADIESLEGRLKYMSSRVDYSTLSVSFYVIKYNEKSFSSRMKNGFVSGWNNLISFVIFLVYNWSSLIIVIFMGWLAKKLWIRFRRVK
ncbi:MAG: DUF4349 domain-containing protein [Flavobacteriales bacterium]